MENNKEVKRILIEILEDGRIQCRPTNMIDVEVIGILEVTKELYIKRQTSNAEFQPIKKVNNED